MKGITVKQMADVPITVLVMVIVSPLIGIIALITKLSLADRVLFTQLRPGLKGRPFVLYKFKTMKSGFDLNGRPLPDSERLTTFGKFLRSTSLDELPELFNVLTGDMSLVGPRPLLALYLVRYTPEQARRHEV
jgi:lipopolysaccharide/colanic/teichoic acid biosynthesis glycosyltransferase